MSIEIKETDFRDLNLALKSIDKKILANLKKELKKTALPAAQAARQAVIATPSTSQHKIKNAPRPRLSLRQSIAMSIKVAIKATKKQTGVFIRVDGKQFASLSEAGGRTGYVKKIPKYLDGRRKRWKHPVFGQNMDKPASWPIQPAHPYLGVTLYKRKDDFKGAIEKSMLDAVDEASKKLRHKEI
jgi:hypothetical protein